jgi:plastocyanin
MFKFKQLGIVAAVALTLAACSSTASPSPSVESEGAAPSAAASASRTVHLDIADGSITPASVTVTKGETVTFEVKNLNTTEVELIMGLKTDVASDSGDSLVEAEHIAAGATKTLTFTFSADGPFAYGDQIGDHYAKGAKGDIVLQP